MNLIKRHLEYFKDNPKGYWFKRKLYGWGWTPVKWQGWLVLLIWLILFILAIVKMDHEWMKNFIFIILLIGILVFICCVKGEKPRWQWGLKDQKTKKYDI